MEIPNANSKASADAELMQKMKKDSMGSVNTAQLALGVLGVAMCLLKLYFAIGQYYFPYEHQPHMELYMHMPSSVIIILEILSSISFLAIGLLVLPQANLSENMYQPYIAVTPTFTFIGSIILWFVTMGMSINMHFVWFVGTNLAFHVVSFYTEWVRLNKSIKSLEKQM